MLMMMFIKVSEELRAGNKDLIQTQIILNVKCLVLSRAGGRSPKEELGKDFPRKSWRQKSLTMLSTSGLPRKCIQSCDVLCSLAFLVVYGGDCEPNLGNDSLP